MIRQNNSTLYLLFPALLLRALGVSFMSIGFLPGLGVRTRTSNSRPSLDVSVGFLATISDNGQQIQQYTR